MHWLTAAMLSLLAWAAQPAPPDREFAGEETCRTCHQARFDSFKKTGMGRSSTVPDVRDPYGDFSAPTEFYSPEADRHYSVFQQDGKYFHREVQRDPGGKEIYSDSREVLYSIGAGDTGRSYLVAARDFLYMSPLSYYTSVRRWDLSPGYREAGFRGFTRPIGEQCMVCHAGVVNSVRGSQNLYLAPPFKVLTITCERCHGPGKAHVELNRAGKVAEALRAIVNPRKVDRVRRDSICDQCHLRGDARVARPGRNPVEFLAGNILDDTVAVFTVPLESKGEVFPGTSHASQIRASRCRNAGHGELTCTSCHSPHSEPGPAERPEYYRKRCLQCHAPAKCSAPAEARKETSPPDNCMSCHMPRTSPYGIPHAATTDHRILRVAARSPYPAGILSDFPEAELKHETAPSPGPLDLRTQALAYAQLSATRRAYRQRGFVLLQRAASEFPDDREVQETFGLIQSVVSQASASSGRAAEALERAVRLGSLSGNVHLRLAELKQRMGDPQRAMALLERALELEPHLGAAADRLAALHVEGGRRERAREVLQRALRFDPGNVALRSAFASLK